MQILKNKIGSLNEHGFFSDIFNKAFLLLEREYFVHLSHLTWGDETLIIRQCQFFVSLETHLLLYTAIF